MLMIYPGGWACDVQASICLFSPYSVCHGGPCGPGSAISRERMMYEADLGEQLVCALPYPPDSQHLIVH